MLFTFLANTQSAASAIAMIVAHIANTHMTLLYFSYMDDNDLNGEGRLEQLHMLIFTSSQFILAT